MKMNQVADRTAFLAALQILAEISSLLLGCLAAPFQRFVIRVQLHQPIEMELNGKQVLISLGNFKLARVPVLGGERLASLGGIFQLLPGRDNGGGSGRFQLPVGIQFS